MRRIEHVVILWPVALWIEGTSVRLIQRVVILWPVAEVVDLIERTSVSLDSAAVDGRHQHEANRGSLLIERVVI